ncbi:uncharacterized protein LOC123293979 [Chrysoperla carnea]|uniref:uncharacterized protein LOC123293979 n=1 Tax=Chrysoperla carnea TaxID=189513 RepID=UPI001D08ADC3|nr:uncharacterized protein LOC123293979 [Chrysoperla carnea]
MKLITMSYHSTMSNSLRSTDSAGLVVDPQRILKSNNSHDSSTESTSQVKLAGDEAKDKMYEPKQNKKVIRVLTVIAYLFFVSLAAIVLSLYYVILWKPRAQRSAGINSTSTLKCQQ